MTLKWKQYRNNKQTEMERFDWIIERIQTRLAFGWLSERSGEKTLCPITRNQPILRFDVILQHDWPIEQCLLHIRVFFGGKTKSPCFDLFIHWLIKQITNTYRNHFSRSYENRSNHHLQKSSGKSGWKINGTWLFGSFKRNVGKGSPVFPEGILANARFHASYYISLKILWALFSAKPTFGCGKNNPLFLRKK